MQTKHPTAEPVIPPEDVNHTPPLRISPNQVKKAKRSFKQGTAPKPTGLRAEHLKEALVAASSAQSNRAAATITALVNLLSAGNFPPGVAKYFCGARLYVARKKDGSYRPITVGNILHRLTSKCLAFAVSGCAAFYLRAHQYGVGVRGRTEGVVHAIRLILKDEDIHPDDKWVLQTDLENAFNLSGQKFSSQCPWEVLALEVLSYMHLEHTLLPWLQQIQSSGKSLAGQRIKSKRKKGMNNKNSNFNMPPMIFISLIRILRIRTTAKPSTLPPKRILAIPSIYAHTRSWRPRYMRSVNEPELTHWGCQGQGIG